MHSSNDFLFFDTQSVLSMQSRRERAASLHCFPCGAKTQMSDLLLVSIVISC